MALLFKAGEPSGKPSSPEETRLRILTAARELYALHGSRGTTTREVAERAGVNEATLFRHFGSKQALLAEMREHACRPLEVGALIASLSGEDIAADLCTFAYGAIARMREMRALMCVSLAEEARGDDTPEWRQPAAILDAMTTYFGARVAEGRLRGDPRLHARFFLGMLFSYVIARKLWEASYTDPNAVPGIVDIFLHGIATAQAEAGAMTASV